MVNQNIVAEYNHLKYNEILSEIKETDELGIPLRDKFIRLKYILERVCKEITGNEILQLSSLFSRIVFISQKYNLSKNLEWHLQNIRVKASFLLKDKQNLISPSRYEICKNRLINFISIIYDNGIGEREIERCEADNSYLPKITLPDKMRVQVLSVDTEKELIYCHADNILIENEIIVRYNIDKVNDIFNSTIERLWIGAQLNIIESKIEEKTGYIIPKIIVLEPDYLIDASALSECFQNYGNSHLHYFRRKFEITGNSRHILLGNLANYFLDEFVYSENPQDLNFLEVFIRAFQQSPFEFTSCDDIKHPHDFKEFMSKSRTQFENIKRVITVDFPANNIHPSECTLEPSFFCEKFGFQGRLDLLQISENETTKIIELKSGGLPFPKEDTGKISPNHEVQTIIYRLMIQSVFNKNARDIFSAILYSVSENSGENIRFSAPYQKIEKEIINIRNLIIATEHDLSTGRNNSVENVFSQLFNVKNYGKTPQFFIYKLNDIEKVLKDITEIERKYFYRFVNFVSTELYLQKTGNEEYNFYNESSCIWLSEFEERKESYNLISELEIVDIDSTGRDMKILFARTSPSNFVNFREGEICILYPKDRDSDTVLTNQILKGTIADIRSNCVSIRFRYKQKNTSYLHQHKKWVIEHDKLDHSYNYMFKSLFTFLTSSHEKRAILLGLSEPKILFDNNIHSKTDQSVFDKQLQIIDKAVVAKDYFLLLGPPGTGKTSVYAKKLVETFYAEPDINILVMAYTNRAVDELCEAISLALKEKIDNNGSYIRIGTELSCGEPYRGHLLQNITGQVKSRDELRSILSRQRIFVGTVAAITGKPEIFDLKKFHIAIVDEASQILEPQIIGLLPKFDKFIMIGDHKQLATITLQNESKSRIIDDDLNGIGLMDCRESYFERLYRICEKNGWMHIYDTLEYQGRMHEEIAAFPNKYFYGGNLKSIFDWQKEPLKRKILDPANSLQQLLAKERIAFISNRRVDITSKNDKTNEPEADLTTSLAKAVIEIYKANNLPYNKKQTLGVITPYRNQIALIKHKLELTGIPELENIMVDTVERFQGSQRDIIILSFCMNRKYQLEFFNNMTYDMKVDRKLNVALTRARQQLFMIGNDLILGQNDLYRKLLREVKIYSF